MASDATSTAELIANGLLVIGDGYRAKNSELSPGGIPFARAGNIEGGFKFRDADHFPVAELKRVGNKVSQSGDVVFTSKGTVGRFAFVKKDTPRFVYSPQLCFWRSLDQDQIDSRWLYYWMQAPEFLDQISYLQNQTDMAAYVSLGDQRKLSITLPPSDDQRERASVLSALDDRIDNNCALAANLESICRALFKSWFVDFDPVRSKAAGELPPGLAPDLAALFPNQFADSELGEIPAGWCVQKISDFCTLVKGRSYKSSELADSNTALVTLKSFLRGGGFRIDGFKSFTGQYRADQIIKPGECVVAYTDVTQQAEVIGRAALVQASPMHETLVASLDTAILRPRADLTPTFLYLMCQTEAYVDHILKYVTGSTVLHLAKDAVPSFKTALPNGELLSAFDEVISPIFRRMGCAQQEIAVLTDIRELLLPRLISGKLRIEDVEDAMAAA